MTRLLAGACALLVLTASAWARGDPSRPSGEVVVEVAAAGDPATTASMAQRIRALGARLGITTRFQARPGIDARDVLAHKRVQTEILARVWLDLSDPKRAVLFIANATHDRFLVRVVPADDGYGELTQESLTTIVESVVDALVSGGQIGVDREEAARTIEEDVGVRVEPAPAPSFSAPAAAPPTAAPVRDEGAKTPSGAGGARSTFVLEASYRAEFVADGPSIRQSPQVALVVTGFGASALDVMLWFGGHYAPPSALGSAPQEVRLHGGGARVAGGVTGSIGQGFAWRAALGAGVDVFDVRADVAPDSGWVGTDGYAIAVPIATAFVGGSLRPAAWLQLPFSLGVDVDPSSHHFDAESGDERTVLVRPWVARPFATVGIGVPFAL